ncbi:MAG: NADH-quinone oxidoreductase subunit L [Thermogemmatispora sp.]|uniref:NADH-quinone oxidoreductase subunit L n=1 Tax=Thermogemmatispora sp. TaxID=1968838 RepID=UPI0019F72066|nr:NADH-quinone oxidoreductase subunit L [Thermogemmatispora sp.]MBE3565237.1 NADH-quinone oxidoreductase subunit L [Thermogemmatispora sp.]
MYGLYEYAWLILAAPLASFVVIVFGTRMADLWSRHHGQTAQDYAAYLREADPAFAAWEATRGAGGHAEQQHAAHAAGPAEGAAHLGHGGEAEHQEHHGDPYDDDPTVPYLTPWARLSGYVGIVLMLFACLYSWLLLFASLGLLPGTPRLPEGGITLFSYTWGSDVAFQPYTIAFHLDNLALAMTVVVTTVSLLVQFYSQGYMASSAGYARFFAYLSLFAFSMLTIVFAANFLVIFVGWELVGLSSYLLIGFWINKRAKPAEERPAPASAALQAFVMNRIGDVGFILGIMILFATTGTFDFATLAGNGPHGVAQAFAGNQALLTLAMILVFCGAIGKSAQVPLHTWLPSAMEGPTPVSALIHAATMVAAGVYMVARTFALFAAAGPQAFGVVAWIGGITAIFAATIGLTQTDFKRVLAFSTISQLGYMFVGLGVAGTEIGPGAGMFHLFTHAFFKALLFLGAGSVLHALHHAMHREVQDMRLMGGLARFMPITAATWLIAGLSISGFPFLSGFYSKETLISLAFEHGDYALWAITLVTAGLTAFYMFRAFFLAFGGKGGALGGIWGGPYRGEGTPHESPVTMTLPLVILAVFSIFAGYWVGFFQYLDPHAPLLDLGKLFSDGLTWLGVALSLLGIAWAYVLYCAVGWERVHKVVEANAVLRFFHRLLLHRYYVDTLYDWIVRYVVLGLCHVAAAFDRFVVDGIVNGVAGLVMELGSGLRRAETGKVQAYMTVFFGGIAVFAVVVFVLATLR